MVKIFLTTTSRKTIKLPMDKTQQQTAQNASNPKNPIFLVTAPTPQDHSPTSWLELLLQDFPLTLNACIGNQPVILTLQDPHYLDNVVRDAIDNPVNLLGNQLWM